MTTPFDTPLNGFTFVLTQRGDTLQRVAARSMGDASKWTQLIYPNNLVYPYLTDDPTQAGPGVLLTGAQILIPAPAAAASTTDPDQVFGTDIALTNGLLGATATGDFAFVTGRANLRQALKNRVETQQGDLAYHPRYGSLLKTLIGRVSVPAQQLLSASSAKGAVLADPRIASVDKAVATVNGDSVSVSIEAVPIAGQSVQVTASA
jgi:phage baseplate assembly protein W